MLHTFFLFKFLPKLTDLIFSGIFFLKDSSEKSFSVAL